MRQLHTVAVVVVKEGYAPRVTLPQVSRIGGTNVAAPVKLSADPAKPSINGRLRGDWVAD